MRPHRRGIPRFEIEVSRGRARGFLAPGVAPFLPALWRSVRGAMKLRFGWQFTAKPLRICGGLGMAHVYRPLQGQAYLAEHAAINPEIAFATPKHSVLHSERGSSGRDLHQMRLHPVGLPSRTLRPAHL